MEASIPPKMKIFFWRMLNNALPLNSNLQKRGVEAPGNCVRCDKKEDLYHTFVGCQWATLFWFSCPLSFRPYFSNSAAFLHWLQIHMHLETDKVLALIITTYWGIWLNRNEIIFNCKSVSPQQAEVSSFQTLSDFRSAYSTIQCNSFTPTTTF